MYEQAKAERDALKAKVVDVRMTKREREAWRNIKDLSGYAWSINELRDYFDRIGALKGGE